MIVSGGASLSSARAVKEPEYQTLNLSLANKLECAGQGVSKLIVNLKSPDLSDSQKNSLREDAKQQLHRMSDNLALITAHKDVVAASSYKLKGLYNQKLDLASKAVRTDYNALQAALDISVGGKHIRFTNETKA